MKNNQIICDGCEKPSPAESCIEINFFGRSATMFDVAGPVKTDFCSFECAKTFMLGIVPDSSWNKKPEAFKTP